jgi:hypothetical protein
VGARVGMSLASPGIRHPGVEDLRRHAFGYARIPVGPVSPNRYVDGALEQRRERDRLHAHAKTRSAVRAEVLIGTVVRLAGASGVVRWFT